MTRQDLPGHLPLRNTKKESNQEGQYRKAVVHPSLGNMKINGTQVLGMITKTYKGAQTTTYGWALPARQPTLPTMEIVNPVLQEQVKEGKTRQPLKLHKEDRKAHQITVSLLKAGKLKQDLNLGLKMRNKGNNPSPLRHGNSPR
jgi:hypothetical protein